MAATAARGFFERRLRVITRARGSPKMPRTIGCGRNSGKQYASRSRRRREDRRAIPIAWQIASLAEMQNPYAIHSFLQRSVPDLTHMTPRRPAKMSHQLRTPLNAIIGYSEILLDDSNPEDKEDSNRASDLKMINSAGRHLLSLVSDVLYMPAIDAEKIELVVQEVDLESLLDNVISTCRSLVVHNRNKVVVEVADDLGTVSCDPIKLHQIIINLLGNAGKFTSDGTITLSARRSCIGANEEIAISVQDTGIGIAPAAIAGLFADYSQANGSISRTYGGTGLGLAVSQKLCHLMNGSIGVESQLGQGSTFTIRIPAFQSLAAAA
jgi:signal transduction histidine kinase